MTCVVYDLEWNSAPPGKNGANKSLEDFPFEIIEIGAVKVSENLEILDSFNAQVRPEIYTKLNKYIARVTGRSQSSLLQGDPFPVVAADFEKFCGDSAIMIAWGQSDPVVYKQNLDFHNIEFNCFKKALDLQVFFAHMAENGQNSQQRSIEYALDFLRIEAELPFHHAISDARYAARILKTLLSESEIKEEPMARLKPFIYDPYLQREKSWQIEVRPGLKSESVIKEQDYCCPVCNRKLGGDEPLICGKKNKRWTWSLFCDVHGQLRLTIHRLRRDDKDIFQFKLALPYPPADI